MKIQKGHYVPKELITSEAVHEAVFKCFVAAGFNDRRPEYGNFGRADRKGLVAYSDGDIQWGLSDDACNKPLTLQQLFTAENGLQWPDGAENVTSYGGDCVAFVGDDVWKIISGKMAGFETKMPLVLAARQPKEKEVSNNHIGEVNKMVDNSWQERGELPPAGVECEYSAGHVWHRCQIKCHVESGSVKVAIFQGENHWGWCAADRFRPIRTERENVIEAAIMAVESNNSTSESIYDTLYSAGMLVLPPEKSDTKD